MRLINWPWLEDLLVRALEAEAREFGEAHRDHSFYAFCLEFNGLDGSLLISYATRADAEARVVALRAAAGDEAICYRAVELQPEGWSYRGLSIRDLDGAWSRAMPILEAFRENAAADDEPDVTEFLWMRFEYLVECVIRRLIDRDGFRSLPRDHEFVAYAANHHERLEELEDRIAKLYPGYRRATQEWSDQSRLGELLPAGCQSRECGRRGSIRNLSRCTHCHRWFCSRCRPEHAHQELSERQPLFWTLTGFQ